MSQLESILWIALQQAGLACHFVREYPFAQAIGRRWRLDFYAHVRKQG